MLAVAGVSKNAIVCHFQRNISPRQLPQLPAPANRNNVRQPTAVSRASDKPRPSPLRGLPTPTDPAPSPTAPPPPSASHSPPVVSRAVNGKSPRLTSHTSRMDIPGIPGAVLVTRCAKSKLEAGAPDGVRHTVSSAAAAARWKTFAIIFRGCRRARCSRLPIRRRGQVRIHRGR